MFYGNTEIINIAFERREIAISNTVRINFFFPEFNEEMFYATVWHLQYETEVLLCIRHRTPVLYDKSNISKLTCV